METPLLGVLIADRYVPTSVLGQGGNAIVFLADDRRTGGAVALKALHESYRRDVEATTRLEREGRIAGGLNHPNICRVFDIGQLPDESPFFVMEPFVGESLFDRITRVRHVPVEEAIDIVYQLLAGLSVAHRRGIVHRDIKPANVFLVPIGPRSTVVKLLDFGGAFVVDASAPGGLPLTQAGLVVGTPMYMAPEQAQGLRDFDRRTDLYVCGVLLYQMVSGSLPFVAKSVRELLESIALRRPRPILSLRPNLSPALVAVIERAMAHERAARFPTAEDFQSALLEAASASAYEEPRGRSLENETVPNLVASPPSGPVDEPPEEPATPSWAITTRKSSPLR
jgi:serine/threonine-protein kinase